MRARSREDDAPVPANQDEDEEGVGELKKLVDGETEEASSGYWWALALATATEESTCFKTLVDAAMGSEGSV